VKPDILNYLKTRNHLYYILKRRSHKRPISNCDWKAQFKLTNFYSLPWKQIRLYSDHFVFLLLYTIFLKLCIFSNRHVLIKMNRFSWVSRGRNVNNITKEVVSFNFTGFQILFLCWISDVLSLISVGFQTFFFEFCLISDVAFFYIYFVGFQILFLKILLDFSCFFIEFR
jgi:hypothetical protein